MAGTRGGGANDSRRVQRERRRSQARSAGLDSGSVSAASPAAMISWFRVSSAPHAARIGARAGWVLLADEQ